MRIACWITGATHTNTEYVIFTTFPQQQLLRGRASTLSYTYEYTACLVFNTEEWVSSQLRTRWLLFCFYQQTVVLRSHEFEGYSCITGTEFKEG